MERRFVPLTSVYIPPASVQQSCHSQHPANYHGDRPTSGKNDTDVTNPWELKHHANPKWQASCYAHADSYYPDPIGRRELAITFCFRIALEFYMRSKDLYDADY